MKKKLLILTSLFLIMFTSGCVKQKDEYIITIDKNANVTLSAGRVDFSGSIPSSPLYLTLHLPQ